jgi:signal transduction histidine kinase
MDTLICPKVDASFVVWSDLVPNLLYYSHIPAMLIMLFLGLFIFLQNRHALVNRLMFVLGVSFFLWALFNLIVWADYDSRIVVFFWSLLLLVEPIIVISAAYLVYAYVYKRDLRWFWKIGLLALYLPFIFFVPTKHTLQGITLSEACEGPEGFLAVQYAYPVELLIVVWMIVISIYAFWKNKNIADRKRIVLISVGTTLFLLSFLWGNIISSLTENWAISQFGMFGAPLFALFIGFLIVKYQAFNTRLFSTQLFTIALSLLIFSQLFFVQSAVNFVLVSITLFLSMVAGVLLVRSVSRELERKNELQSLADDLAVANQRLKKLDQAKSEFISIASHQLRTPLTAIKGFISLILEDSYGKVEKGVRGALNKVYLSNERLIQLVEDLLSISRIESGRLEYNFRKWDVQEIAEDVVDMFRLRAREVGLELRTKFPEKGMLPEVVVDGNKLREVISNLIDNALKYTNSGYVEIALFKKSDAVIIAIKDSGIGIREEDFPYLFQKFSRGKDMSRLHANGTGLGLYVGRQIIEAHKGKLYAVSEGEGKGSVFYIEIPLYGVEENKKPE